MDDRERAVWPPFVVAAVAIAATAGFGLGAALFAASAWGQGANAVWAAAARAHGHAQLFGWAGLMVLGVGLHFLPRLRGAALRWPRLARAALYPLALGITGRAAAGPALAAGALGAPLGWALPAMGAAELAGATLVLAALVATHRAGPPLAERPGLGPVLPLFGVGLAAGWVALAVNLAALTAEAAGGGPALVATLDRASVQLALDGFLVPVAVAMSARTFPLYFQARLPDPALLRMGLGLAVAGLVARLAADAGAASAVGAAGQALLAGSGLAFVVGLRVFAPRRAMPRKLPSAWAEPIHLHALAAYGWLAVAAALRLSAGLGGLGLPLPPLPADVERHALGAGFVTLLILGIGARLLPGFAGRPLRSRALLWATLLLGGLAALLRVVPLLLPLGGARVPLLAAAGLAGLAAVAAFAVDVPLRPGARSSPGA